MSKNCTPIIICHNYFLTSCSMHDTYCIYTFVAGSELVTNIQAFGDTYRAYNFQADGFPNKRNFISSFYS